MSKTNKDERNPFRVDADRLDRECIKHPNEVYRYGIALADAKQKLEEASQAYEILKAKLDQQIRDKPQKYKLVKITEAGVAAARRASPEHQAAKEEVSKAQHEVDVLFAAVNALSHKRDMLTNLIALRKMDYFSEPLVEKEDVEEIKKDAARRKGGIKK